MDRGCLRHLSDDQNPDSLFYIWDYTTQSYTVEIIKRNYKDSYEPTTTMECHRDFERCACWSSSVLCFLRNSSISITLYDLLVPVRWSRLIQSFQVTWTSDREYYISSLKLTQSLNMDSWKTSFLLGSLFSGDMLRSFREGIRLAELVNLDGDGMGWYCFWDCDRCKQSRG